MQGHTAEFHLTTAAIRMKNGDLKKNSKSVESTINLNKCDRMRLKSSGRHEDPFQEESPRTEQL